MSSRLVKANVCDVCGHIWLWKPGKQPDSCPKKTCRSRLWNGPNGLGTLDALLQAHARLLANTNRSDTRSFNDNKDLAALCHAIVNASLRRKDIVRPCTCSQCSKSCRPIAHHDDYAKPLQIRWLCARDHRLHHLTEIQPQAPIKEMIYELDPQEPNQAD